jgi:hypothetical protein
MPLTIKEAKNARKMKGTTIVNTIVPKTNIEKGYAKKELLEKSRTIGADTMKIIAAK